MRVQRLSSVEEVGELFIRHGVVQRGAAEGIDLDAGSRQAVNRNGCVTGSDSLAKRLESERTLTQGRGPGGAAWAIAAQAASPVSFTFPNCSDARFLLLDLKTFRKL